jgi:hypothetical protein
MSNAVDTPQSEKERRKRGLIVQYLLVLVAAVLVSGLLGFGAGVLDGYIDHADSAPPWMGVVRDSLASPWLLGVAFVAIFAWAMWWALAYWRQIDELARAAHERAWFWGGSAAMALGLSALMIASVVPPFCNMTFPDLTPMQLITAGAVSLTGLMMLGYGVVWAFIWWRAR